MKIKCLGRPKDENLVNACLDVLVFLKDEYCNENEGFCYVVEVTTPDYLSSVIKESETCLCAIKYDDPDELPSQEKFYNSVKEVFFKLQKYFDK